MSDGQPPIICLWDGKLRRATVWNYQVSEPELTVHDANFFVHLSAGDACTAPSFSIRFETLVYSRCQPLIEKALVFQSDLSSSIIVSTSQSSRAPTLPKLFCSLFIEPPNDCKAHEIIQYHITSRNFFAWMMGLPVVGPDISSALLALKVRMDAWRIRTADNFAAIYKYAKAQGYGELGDLQAVLSRRLSGNVIRPTGYTMVTSADGHWRSEQAGGKTTLTRSITRKIQLVRRRISESQMEMKQGIFHPPESECSSRRSTSLKADESRLPLAQDETIMSGCLVATKNDRPSYMPLQSVQRKPDSICSLRLSLPNLSKISGGTIDAISQELESQTCWMQNLSREHSLQLTAQLDNAVATSAFHANTSFPSTPSSSSQQAGRGSTLPSSLISPVSPITENEGVDELTPLPPPSVATQPSTSNQHGGSLSMLPSPISPIKEDEVLDCSIPLTSPSSIDRKMKRVTWSPAMVSKHEAQPLTRLEMFTSPAPLIDESNTELTRFPSLHKDKSGGEATSEIARNSLPARSGTKSALKYPRRSAGTAASVTTLTNCHYESEPNVSLGNRDRADLDHHNHWFNLSVRTLVSNPASASVQETSKFQQATMPEENHVGDNAKDADRPMLVRQMSDQLPEAAISRPIEGISRSYRVPLEPQAVGTADSQMMDYLLEKLMTTEYKSPVESETRIGDVKCSDPDVDADDLLASMQIPKYGSFLIEKGPFFSSRKRPKQVKLRKRFSLTGRVEKQVAEVVASHAKVLVLDKNGHFSAMWSPAVEAPLYHDDSLPTRARTPMCEFDV